MRRIGSSGIWRWVICFVVNRGTEPQGQEALDGTGVSVKGHKSRNQLFTAIENGDFDDFWPTGRFVSASLEVLTNDTLAPAKKGKNKHVPAELQNQWQKDRQKKAAKKRQRDLDRLAAELDPYPAARKKGKGQSKAHQASLAHLIPASATEVAEMFDISSDEEMMLANSGFGAGGRGGARGRGGLLPKPMEQIDLDIRGFLDAQGKNTFSLAPMDKEGRRKIHMLAECYGLKSKSRGKGRSRFTWILSLISQRPAERRHRVLIKTSRTGLFIDEDSVQRLISASTFSGGGFYKAVHTKYAGGGKGKKVKVPGGGRADGGTRHREGDQVGEGAERIGGDNIGHKLLSKMGCVDISRIANIG